jgi:hypothetical protein
MLKYVAMHFDNPTVDVSQFHTDLIVILVYTFQTHLICSGLMLSLLYDMKETVIFK